MQALGTASQDYIVRIRTAFTLEAFLFVAYRELLLAPVSFVACGPCMAIQFLYPEAADV
jgi:hypothetical protein